MAMTVTKTWAASPYTQGLGVNTPLGTAFLRKISCVFDGAETGTVVVGDLGCINTLDVFSVIMKSTNSVYVGTITATTIPLTSSGACTAEIIALVRGL